MEVKLNDQQKTVHLNKNEFYGSTFYCLENGLIISPSPFIDADGALCSGVSYQRKRPFQTHVFNRDFEEGEYALKVLAEKSLDVVVKSTIQNITYKLYEFEKVFRESEPTDITGDESDDWADDVSTDILPDFEEGGQDIIEDYPF